MGTSELVSQHASGYFSSPSQASYRYEKGAYSTISPHGSPASNIELMMALVLDWNYQSGPCMNLTGQDLREEQELSLELSLDSLV
jgi:hypothetical protein